MRKFLERIPLHYRLFLIGVIPLLFAVVLTIQFFNEKERKLRLLNDFIGRINQSAIITKLIDAIQTERNASYYSSLTGENKELIPAHRASTDSLIELLVETGNGLSNFREYTFLSNLSSVRSTFDSTGMDPNQVVHFYTTIIFRLNTLNPIMPGASIFLSDIYPDLVSQKLLSEIITYQSIVNTNVYNTLYTKKYATETLMGTLGTYQVYKSYEKEFYLKASPEEIARYDLIRNGSDLGSVVRYTDTLFRRFAFDSTYNAREWGEVATSGMNKLRGLQQEILARIEVNAKLHYKEERNTDLTTGILFFVLLAGIIAIVLVTIITINRTLVGLKRSAERIAAGKPLEGTMPSGKDVVGSLARSIYRIDESNRALAEAADKIGKGNFGIDLHLRSEEDILGRAILNMKEELKQYTSEIAESEERTWHLFQSLPAAVYSCDPQGRIRLFNQAAEKLWGGRPDEQHNLWSGAWRIYDAKGTEMRREDYPMALVLSGRQESYDEEIIVERKDGSRRIVLPHPRVLRDAAGRITGGINMMVDITEEKSAEKDKARLAAIVESTVDAIISKTLEGIITTWNPGAEAIFGYTAEEMIGQPVTRIIPPERLFEEPGILERIKRGERIVHFETQRVHKDGRRLDISLSISPIIDERGQVIGASKIARDITQQMEVARRINENEERLRLAISSTQLGTWDYLPATGEVKWSDECKRIFNVPDDAPVNFDFFASFIHPEDGQKLMSDLQEAMDPASGGVFDSTFRILRHGEKATRWIHSKGKAMFNKEGRAERMIGTVVDMTIQKLSESALLESEQRTRLALEAAQMGSFEWDFITDHFIGSPRLGEIFGQDVGMADHRILVESIHPDDRTYRDQVVNEAMKKGSLNYELRILWPDQSVHWVRVYGKIIYGAERKPLRMYGTVEDVTEEHTTLQKLEESTEKLKIAIEAVEMGTWELNFRTGKPVYSDRYLQLLGFEAGARPEHEELLQRIHPDDLHVRNNAMEQAKRTGKLDLEMRIITLKKDIRWVKSQGTVFYDRKGNPERILGTLIDITEQKNAFHVLQESEERFKTIANTAPVMIWMSGEDRFSDFFNTSWLDFTGRSIEQERGEGWIEAVHPDDVSNCIDTYNRAFASRRPFCVEYRLRRRDGVYRWISDNAIPRFDGNGGFLGFISACRDIDDEKRFNQKLKESELLFKTITNVAPVGLWMTDEEGRNNFVNDTWIQWTGMSNDMQTGQGWMRVVIAADQEYISKKFQQAFQARKVFDAEFRIKRRDGQVRWVISEGSPYYDINGTFAGYAGSVADITERKEDEIRRNEFLAVASHELKTPLTSVKAYTQLLEATYRNSRDEFLKNALRKVENQANKMTKLVGDFLNLSKIESDKFELGLERFDLAKLAEEVAGDIQMVSPQHTIRVVDNGPAVINADHEKIAQVVTNFLNNAVKYSPEGTAIEVKVCTAEGRVRLSVRDQGIGIKPEEHQRIFQRFYRSRFNHNISYSGFGIGLYISAEIIQRHDGGIGVESSEGEGSTFYFTLPAAE